MKITREIENCFPILEKQFGKQAIKELINCEFSNLSWYHFGLGTWIREHLLNENQLLFQMLTQSGIRHKDEMSWFILQMFYLYVHMK